NMQHVKMILSQIYPSKKLVNTLARKITPRINMDDLIRQSSKVLYTDDFDFDDIQDVNYKNCEIENENYISELGDNIFICEIINKIFGFGRYVDAFDFIIIQYQHFPILKFKNIS